MFKKKLIDFFQNLLISYSVRPECRTKCGVSKDEKLCSWIRYVLFHKTLTTNGILKINYLVRDIFLFGFLFISTFSYSKNVLQFMPAKDFESSQADGQLSKFFLKHLEMVFKPDVFFETGTFKGLTAFNASNFFKEVYTTESNQNLYNNFLQKFSHIKNIYPILGNSGEIMKFVINKLNNKKVIFWLDEHEDERSTPILEELKAIKNANLKDPVILIDDMRFFQPKTIQELINKNYYAINYPTLQDIKKLAIEINADNEFLIYGDIIMIFPKSLNIEIPEIIRVMTHSQMYDESDKSLEIKQMEMKLTKINALEKTAIKQLYKLFYYPELNLVNRHFKLWNALTLIGEKKFNEAENILKSINVHSTNIERINFYINLCN